MIRLCVILAVLIFSTSTRVVACELKLMLAVDVSASVSEYEYNLQRSGMSAAFRDTIVTEAIQSMNGGIMVALSQWGGPNDQDLSIGWTHVQSRADAIALAGRIDGLQNPFDRPGTAVGNALHHAGYVLADAPVTCRRAMIDVSSDGVANFGINTAEQADALAQLGVSINALIILVDQGHMDVDLVTWFTINVLRGPHAFSITARTFNDYPEAFRRKLLRELRPQYAQLDQ